LEVDDFARCGMEVLKILESKVGGAVSMAVKEAERSRGVDEKVSKRGEVEVEFASRKIKKRGYCLE
jgi:hypothetical protein